MNGNRNLKKPVIILGPPRSGTTILGDLLSRHPDSGYFEEPRSVWRWGNEEHSDVLSADKANEKVCEYVRHYFSKELDRMRKVRLIEKTPQNCLRPYFVDRIFPDAKYVVITRNPYETIASIVSFWIRHTHGVASIGGKKLLDKLIQTSPRQYLPYALELIRRLLPRRSSTPAVMWGPRLPGLNEMVRDMRIEEVAAYQWRECLERVYQFSKDVSERVSVWSLEELDENAFREILRFVELSEDEEMIDIFLNKFSYTGVRRNREISSEFISLVTPIIAPTICYLKQAGWPLARNE